MAITRKPKPSTASSAAVDVDALINKGGSVTRPDSEQAKSKQVYVQLRLSEDLLQQIDQSLSSREIKIPRHTWLLEAIHEKLKREHNQPPL